VSQASALSPVREGRFRVDKESLGSRPGPRQGELPLCIMRHQVFA
jgi:hypothetical protein